MGKVLSINGWSTRLERDYIKRMKTLIYSLVFLTMYALNLNATDNTIYSEEYPVVSKFNKTSDGKVYYEVNGVPFMFIGTKLGLMHFKIVKTDN